MTEQLTAAVVTRASAWRVYFPNIKRPQIFISAVYPHHVGDLRVRRLHQHPSVGGNIVHELVERRPLDLLTLQVGHRVVEVEEHAALLEFLGEQFLLLSGGSV